MKKYLKAFFPLFSLMFLFTVWPAAEGEKVHAQAEIVHDPTNYAGLVQQSSILTSMMDMQDKMARQAETIEKIKDVTGFIKDAKTVYDMAKMMADLICTYKNIQLTQDKRGMLELCHFRAQYQIGMLNIQAATDVLSLIIDGGLKMDQGLRVQNLKNAIDLFTQGHSQVMKVNSQLKFASVREKNQQMYESSMMATMAIYRY